MLLSALIADLQAREKLHGDIPVYVDLPIGPSPVSSTTYSKNEHVNEVEENTSNGRSKWPAAKIVPELLLILHEHPS